MRHSSYSHDRQVNRNRGNRRNEYKNQDKDRGHRSGRNDNRQNRPPKENGYVRREQHEKRVPFEKKYPAIEQSNILMMKATDTILMIITLHTQQNPMCIARIRRRESIPVPTQVLSGDVPRSLFSANYSSFELES
ncbi:hypothetical protein NXS19_002519 [Fusarium pseudograminearum]|uniref:Uncharacterized protein n=2 Tax=Fusarium pseudograminearum TaxID=101028 RepID=K3VKU1_FUSPC|nr:hypothetical protein FPSE_05727 [Fusarium pseudograminearum CS3096]EKJ74073.1 hypothetical protein FPSE_05727 [Fusarium pseudograminearum CS3096]KAF0635489.1 hypothetical protein FPSE5266_05727 [Fusarium pseudograminearum]UZP34703.1 hypothetical protein NXS19_002519 [Fusarium pseudograminearum]CEG02395.1 unnamed protein product [Fusarium pseudograminearum CS3427]